MATRCAPSVAGMGGRNGDIVVDAEPHGPGALGMMAGRTHQRDRLQMRFPHDALDRNDGRSGREPARSRSVSDEVYVSGSSVSVARPAVPAMRVEVGSSSCTRASCSRVASGGATTSPPCRRHSRRHRRPSRRRARGAPDARAASDARQIVRTRSGRAPLLSVQQTTCTPFERRSRASSTPRATSIPSASASRAAPRAVLPSRAPRARDGLGDLGAIPAPEAPVAIRLDVKRQHGVAAWPLPATRRPAWRDPRRTARAVDGERGRTGRTPSRASTAAALCGAPRGRRILSRSRSRSAR